MKRNRTDDKQHAYDYAGLFVPTCYLIKYNYMKKILAAVFVLLSMPSGAADIQAALDGLSNSDREWLLSSCPKSLGPSLWKNCIDRELGALVGGMPSLDGLSSEERQWVFDSCPKSLGASLQKSCLNREIPALKTNPEIFNSLSKEQTEWVLESCPKTLGPSLQKSCINREIGALNGTTYSPSKKSSVYTGGNSYRSSGGCGSRGGPGYRKANGKCASWND